MYWYFWVIVVALEAVAGARLINYWYPELTPWMLTLGLVVCFSLLNLLSVRSWGESEYWFASIKVAAIVVFLCVGLAYILGLWPGAGGGIANLTSHGGFMPNGIGPVLTGAVAATGFYFGAEIVTVAAAESAAPEQAVAAATQSVISRVLVFYVGSIFVVVALLPWNRPGDRPAVRQRAARAAGAGGRPHHERGDPDCGAVGAQQRPIRFLAHADGAGAPR